MNQCIHRPRQLDAQDQKLKEPAFAGSFDAERAGFEPAVRFNPYAALAKRCFRPLSHLSRTVRLAYLTPSPSTIKALLQWDEARAEATHEMAGDRGRDGGPDRSRAGDQQRLHRP